MRRIIFIYKPLLNPTLPSDVYKDPTIAAKLCEQSAKVITNNTSDYYNVAYYLTGKPSAG